MTTAAAIVCLNSAQLMVRQLLRMSLHATRAESYRLHATRAETAQCFSKAYGEDAVAVRGGGGSRCPLIWDARALKLERSGRRRDRRGAYERSADVALTVAGLAGAQMHSTKSCRCV